MKIPVADLDALEAALNKKFVGLLTEQESGDLSMRVPGKRLIEIMTALRDEAEFGFAQLIDLCGIDCSAFGSGYEGLFTKDALSKASMESHEGEGKWSNSNRFAVVYHLLSLRNNHRLRVRVLLPDEDMPVCPTVTSIWPVANWFEREAFDLYGIIFENHPDLRRILTDYGFIGHPFRKDFPVYGTVEMRYDPAKGRVVYQPVTIAPREVVPRIRRSDNFGVRQDG